ncbi:hypothetical protein BC830DRAFT_1227496 [Chytriomyces sp. MP71]|nr:hypothetical protein BC830DRAFT_1227496 [Chytriomyces sp. MP71]
MEGHVDGQFLKVMAKNSVHCKEILSNDLGIKDVRIRALLADSICALFEETPAFAYAGGSAQGAAGGVAAPPGYSEF